MSWIRASRAKCSLLAAPAFALCTGVAEVALAQPHPGDAAMAETLFNDAKRRMATGDYASACPKLAESYRLDPGGGTLTALAACHEGSGKTASAWTEFLQVVSEARQAGRADRERFAQQHIHALEPKLSKLTVVVDPAIARLPGLEVSRDGTLLGPAGWGMAAPVDPGEHTIEVKATNKKPWAVTVTIGPVSDVQTVTLPAPADLPVPSAAPLPESSPARAEAISASEEPVPNPAPPPPDLAPTPTGNGQRTVGLLVIGAGLVAAGVGTYFGVQAISKSNRAKALCSPGECTNPEAVSVNDDAKSAAVTADVTLGLALAALATGVVVYIVAPSAPEPSLERAAAEPPTCPPRASTEGRAVFKSAALHVVPFVSTRGGAVVLDASW
jgi:hypothetical protein